MKLRNYIKYGYFKILGSFAFLSPNYWRFKLYLSSLYYDKPLACFLFGRFGHAGAETYVNSIIDEINKDYSCLLVVETKAADVPKGNYSILNMADYSANRIMQYVFMDLLFSNLKPNTCASVTSASFYRYYFLKRTSVLKNTAKLIFFFFSRELFLNYDNKLMKKIYTDATWVIADNKRALNDLNEKFSQVIDYTKSYCLYNKVKIEISELQFNQNLKYVACNIENNQELKILWASRLDRDKNLDLLLKFATKYTNIQFDIFGQSLFNNATDLIEQLLKLPNINFKGNFRDITQLITPEFKYVAFMFTSYWEGLPNILLEIGLSGIPVIAPNVGGVNELIYSTTGYLVENTIEGYYQGLMQIIENSKLACTKATNLRHLILRRHGSLTYRDNIKLLYKIS